MPTALKAGLLYFATVFAVGFVLGTIRVLVLVPRLGSTLAVTIELPIILTASWLVCRWITDSLSVPQEIALRLVMGGSAFALTIAAELILGRYGFERTLSQMLAAFGTAEGALGLLGQIAFAAFPLLQRRTW